MPERGRHRPTIGSSAGRVIAGSGRGARLVGSRDGTRPLGDRVKQTLFAILEPHLAGRPFLDLYAGSGAAGIEALSRGASRAVFVESDREALRAIEANLRSAGFAAPAAVIVRASVGPWLSTQVARARREAEATDPFAAVFADPPYDARGEVDRMLEAVARGGPGGLLARDGLVIAKHFWKAVPTEEPLLRSFRQERFGETMLTFYRWADELPADGEAS